MSVTLFPLRTHAPDPRARTHSRTFAPAPMAAAPPAGPQQFPLSFAVKLTPRQAAKRLGVTLSTVYRLIDSEVLEASKVGGRWVVYASAVERLLEHRKNTNA